MEIFGLLLLSLGTALWMDTTFPFPKEVWTVKLLAVCVGTLGTFLVLLF